MTDTEMMISAAQALDLLKKGNARFVGGHTRFLTMQNDILQDLAKGQQPYATILGCSDSRVPPELVFDASFGELFVLRVAGNVLGPSILGTLQYAASHLRTPLFVVLGHSGCGALKAAIDAKFRGAEHESRIEVLLEDILPALDDLDVKQSPDDMLHAAVEANVRYTVQKLLQASEVQEYIREDQMMSIGAVYNLETGQVRFLQ